MQPAYRKSRRLKVPASPPQLAGSALLPKLIVPALLAIAVLFYIRAVLPPSDDQRQDKLKPQTIAQEDQEATPPQAKANPFRAESTPAKAPTQKGTALAPSSPPSAAGSPPWDSKPVGALADGIAAEVPPSPSRELTDLGVPSPLGAAGKSGSNGRLAVPESQIEAIKRVFAPELLMPADAGSQ